MSPDDDLYDAKVTVLGEYINHHVQEEEGEMFPKARRAKVDLVGLGEQLIARKAATDERNRQIRQRNRRDDMIPLEPIDPFLSELRLAQVAGQRVLAAAAQRSPSGGGRLRPRRTDAALRRVCRCPARAFRRRPARPSSARSSVPA